ncbi:MAG: hypothetical protein GX416_05860 [Bacteroidales bacterium]|nr:hypothetical protein [Bacteroidales bacterium]
MTEDQKKQLNIFEIRLHRLLYLCDELKKRNVDLSKDLDMETKRNETLTVELENLKKDYTNLKTATVISLRTQDVKDSKKRLSNIVREIDKCIALMNE